MFKNALVSVSDKSGLADFIGFFAQRGMRVVSTGGTAQHLREAGIKVIDVSEQTGFEEVMDGRVKTLHPKVHMALLARQDHHGDEEVLKQFGVEKFDLVVGNLYPFENKLQAQGSTYELIESIDIGGPSFLRAAAKNWSRITVVCDPGDYAQLREQNGVATEDKRRFLAAKVFNHIASYDSMIAKWLSDDPGKDWSLAGELVQPLRYGENPQQNAWWYRSPGSSHGLHQASILQGKALSYNNLLDLDAALAALSEFSDESAVVAVKHNNPCGLAVGHSPLSVLESGLKADPVSVFGGIVATNFNIAKDEAKILEGLFLECLIAPKIEPEAQQIFKQKKNFRVLEWAELGQPRSSLFEVKTVLGGFLLQTHDKRSTWSSDWKWTGGCAPSDQERTDLMLAWKAAKYLKSNAIAIAGQGQSLGLGMGQVNRIDAVEQAISRWKKHHSTIESPVLASDAFFPFADSIERIAEAGIRWVIQPGGSVRDSEVLEAAEKHGIRMVLTGLRHFRH